jgi:hypothetical protein
MTMNEAQRVQFLATLGITDDAPATPAQIAELAKHHTITVLPSWTPSMGEHTMPVSDIEFDPADIAEFGDLEGLKFREASAKLFTKYRSPKKDSDRHALLHRRITEFLGKQRSLMKSGGFVAEKVKATKEQREIAQFIATAGITMEDLAALVKGDVCAPSAGTADSASGL